MIKRDPALGEAMYNRTACFVIDKYDLICCVAEATEMKYKTHLSVMFASSFVFLVLSPVAVVGNALILAAIWKRTFERTWFHILLSGLAFSDFCAGLIVQPFLGILFFLLFDDNPGVLDAEKRYSVASIISKIGFMSATFLVTVEILLMTLLSIERWLHMTRRSLMTPRRRCFIVILLLVVPASIVVPSSLHHWRLGRVNVALTIVYVVVVLMCYLITLFAYCKVYRIIRQHQQQVQGNQASFQHCGQPGINLVKYKESVKSILYVSALFSITLIPVVAAMALLLWKENTTCLEVFAVSYVNSSICFLSASLNPALYLWRMKEVREGVKSLFCANE